ncbi:MAG: hypothetical protein ABL997_21105 [Planctomycetota bacterium]
MADPAVMRRKLDALRGFLEGLRRRFAAMDRATFVANEDARLEQFAGHLARLA